MENNTKHDETVMEYLEKNHTRFMILATGAELFLLLLLVIIEMSTALRY